MVTYYNRKDLISFGNYLLSEGRKQQKVNTIHQWEDGSISKKCITVEELSEQVSHADISNWMDKNTN